MTFKSKVDVGAYVVLLICLLLGGMLIFAALQMTDGSQYFLFIGAILTIVPVPWVLLSTSYRVEDGVLLIRCGPTRWRIALDSISAVRETRSTLSAPALSMHRLIVEYGQYKQQVMISPKDQGGFLRAIGQELVA